MKKFVLIFKNNWQNIRKLWAVFVFLTLIIILFSTSFTLFWEFNRQFSQNIKNSNLKNSQFDLMSQYQKNLANSRNAFCTAFYSVYDEKDQVKRRLPALTFGGEEGCFQALDVNKFIFNFEFGSEFQPLTNRRRIVAINNIYIPQQLLKINPQSRFYQNSVHGLLKQKFRETEDENYLNKANFLEKFFFPDYLKYYGAKLTEYLNTQLLKTPVYTTSETKSLPYGDFLQHFSSGLPLETKTPMNYQYSGSNVIWDLHYIYGKGTTLLFPDQKDFTTAKEKTRLFLDRFKKFFVQFDEAVWQQGYALNFASLITNLEEYTKTYLPWSPNLVVTFPYRKEDVDVTKLTAFRNSYAEKYDAAFDDLAFVNKANLNNVLKVIKASIENQSNFLLNHAKNKYFVNFTNYLFKRLFRVKTLLNDLIESNLPGFKIYQRLKHAYQFQNYGANRSEQLRYFNYNGQTLNELWAAKRFQFPDQVYLLNLLNTIETRRILEKQRVFLQTYQTSLQTLETTLLGDTTWSTKIYNNLATDKSLTNKTDFELYFWKLTETMLAKKAAYIEINKFYGVSLADFKDQAAFQTFQTFLTKNFSLDQTLIETDKSVEATLAAWNNFAVQLQTVEAKIIARVLAPTATRRWLTNASGLNLKTADDVRKAARIFTKFIDPYQPRVDQWRVFKNYIVLKMFQQGLETNPQTLSVDLTQTAYFAQAKLLEDLTFQKFFRYFYFGLASLTDTEYQTFQTERATLLTTNFNIIKTLMVNLTGEIVASSNRKKTFPFQFATAQKTYSKPMTEFAKDIAAGTIDETLQTHGMYLLTRLYFWMFIPGFEYQIGGKYDYLPYLDYAQLAMRILNRLLTTLKWHPAGGSGAAITQIKGNALQIDSFFNWILSQSLGIIYQDPANFKFLGTNINPRLYERLTTLSTLHKLKSQITVEGRAVSDLNINVSTFKVPNLLKHWSTIFTTQRQIFSVGKMNAASNTELLKTVLTTNPTTVFTVLPNLLKTQPGDEIPNLNTPILTYNSFFEQIQKEFVRNLNAQLPTAVQDKFTVSIRDNDKQFAISYLPTKLFAKIPRFNNLKREFLTQYFLVVFNEDVTFNAEKRLQAAWQATQAAVLKIFQTKQTKYQAITKLANWQTIKNLDQTFANAVWKMSPTQGIAPYRKFLTQSEVQWNEIVATLFGIQIKPLRFLYFQNSKNNETFLVVNKVNVDLFLHEGYLPRYANEIVISPLYAKYKNIAVGDYVSFVGVNNFKVSGIGTSNKFIYPALNYVDLIPRLDSNIIYVSEGFFTSNLLINLKENFASDFWFTNEYFFFSQNASDLSTQQKWANYQKFLGYTSNIITAKEQEMPNQARNYTNFLETLFPDYEANGKNYAINDQQFLNFKQTGSLIPFYLNSLIPLTIYRVVFYVFLYIVIILGLIVVIAILHLFTKKVEINRWQFGILKALGFGNWYILLSLISFMIFLILGAAIGWVIGTLLQQTFFTLFTNKILFKFKYFYFNYEAFYLALVLFVFFVIIALVYYNFRVFSRLSAIRFMSQSSLATRKTSARLLANWIKTRLLNPFWKINYILFDTIGKKILFLFLIVFLIASNFVGVTLFISGFYKTQAELKKEEKIKWVFKYRAPVAGQPLSKYNFFTNQGAQAIWDKPADDVTPTQNISGEAYLKQPDQTMQKQSMNLTEILSFLQVLQGKAINFKKINRLLKESQSQDATTGDDFNRYVCNIIRNIFEKQEIDSVNCLESILNRAVPFTEFASAEQEKTAKEHFPIGFNSVSYDPVADQLHTLVAANFPNNEIRFDLYGIDNPNRFLTLDKTVKTEFFTTSPKTATAVIPLIVNRFFADQLKKTVGSRFNLEVSYLQAYLYDEISKRNIALKNEDWYYYDLDETTNQPIRIPYVNLPYDVQYYHGSFLTNVNKNPTVPDKYRIQTPKVGRIELRIVEKFNPLTKTWETYRPHYKTTRESKPTYLKYVNVDNIVLQVGEYTYYPFRFTKESENRIRKVSNMRVWWDNVKFQIKNEKKQLQGTNNVPYQFKIIAIVPGFNQAEAYLPQGFLNAAIWNNSVKTNKYAASKDVINPQMYFNVRMSPFAETYNAIYNFALTNGPRYVDFSTVGADRQPVIFRFRNLGLERKYRIAFLQFGFKVIWILILFNLLTLVFLFALMVKIIFDIFQANTLLLRILGYSSREIAVHIFIIMFTPIVTAFALASIVVKNLLDLFISYLIENHQIYIFYISDLWIFLACFGFFILLWLGIYFFYMRTINRTNLANRLKVI